MKYLTLLVLILFFSCSQKVNQPIVDYSTNNAENERLLAISVQLKKQNEQAVVLINKKESDYDNLRSLIQKNKIKSLNIIKDSSEIQQLNYSYNKIKTIIIGTKK